MPQTVAYCSAMDRPVPVRPLDEARDGAHDPPRLVCLDYGVRCSGAFCPKMLWIPDDEEGVQPAPLVRISPLPRAS